MDSSFSGPTSILAQTRRLPDDERPNCREENRVNVVIIPCMAKKCTKPAEASRFYLGPLFDHCLRTARLLTIDSLIFVLSAKHGLLRLTDLVSPYDLRLGMAGSMTVEDVRRQAERIGIEYADAVILCTGDYEKMCRQIWPRGWFPLSGIYPYGRQLTKLKEIRDVRRQEKV